MRKYALVDGNIVTEILDLDEDGYIREAKCHDAIVDIEDLTPQPSVGWTLDGNQLVGIPESSLTPEQVFENQCARQRVFGESLVRPAIDKIGARNLLLISEGTSVNIISLATQMQGVKALLEGGALKTARSLLGSLKPSFPLHADILDGVVNDVSSFLINNGYE